MQKYGSVDDDDIKVKFDAIKQEPKERVQKYFERLDKLFRKGKVQDAEQRKRFLARLRLEIRKLCVVRTFADIEELVGTATEVERVLAELGETPYEPLREEQEEEASGNNMENPVVVLNNTLIDFFKGSVPNPVSLSYSTMFEECQICRGRDHVATTCPRLNEARLRYAKCNMSYRTENSGSKHTFCAELGSPRTKVGRSPKVGSRILERRTLWKFCRMMKQLCSNSTGCAEVKGYFRILEHLGEECQSKLRQEALYRLLKLQMGSPSIKN